MNEKEIIKSDYAYNARKVAVLVFCLFFLIDLAMLTIYSLIKWPSGEVRYYIPNTGGAWSTYYRTWTPLTILDAFENLAIPAILILVIGIALAIIISKFKSEITVTDKRVYGMGIFGKRVDLPLDSISAIGSLSFFKGISVATASGSIKFFGIKNYIEIHEIMSKLLIDRQEEKQEAFGRTIIQNSSNADELKKYKDLLDSGVISQEEFDAKKKQILGL